MKIAIVGLVSALLIIAVGVYLFSDIGLDYEHACVHPNQSFKIDDSGNVSFSKADTHVLEYVVGRDHSRVTTAHGYWDRILIQFKDDPESVSGKCTILRAARVGYRRIGNYQIHTPKDIWVDIRQGCDHYHVNGAIKLTHVDRDGKFNTECWDVVLIEQQCVDVVP